MLRQQTKDHIYSLSDSELLEYVLTGLRMYEPDAISFARAELDRRALPADKIASLRPAIVEALIRQDVHNPPERIRVGASTSVVCDGCGLEAPLRHVTYREHVGAIVLRFPTVYQGSYCRKCNSRLFWSSTTTTFFLGWWGVISFFVTPANLLDNIITFLRSRSLAPVPLNATRPQLDAAASARLAPYQRMIEDRLVAYVDISDLAREIAPLAGVTPGQAWRYIQPIIRRINEVPAPPQDTRRGFAVVVPASNLEQTTDSDIASIDKDAETNNEQRERDGTAVPSPFSGDGNRDSDPR